MAKLEFDNKLKPKVEKVSLFPEMEQQPIQEEFDESVDDEFDGFDADGAKQKFQQRFQQLYPNKRLLAVQLNGFNHTIFADDGTGQGQVEVIKHNPNMPEAKQLTPESEKFFEGYPTYNYQGNPKEILYVAPNQRKAKVK